MTMSIAALAAGALSALMYGWRRRWTDAALALLAGVALAATLGHIARPGKDASRLTVITDGVPASATASGPTVDLRGDASAPALAEAWSQAASVTVLGHGLSSAQLRDLPARPLTWQAPPTPSLWLDFPRQLALGRVFTLTVRQGQSASSFSSSSQPGWRLQLLAENGEILAESGAGAATSQLSVQWLPPLAEPLVLQARLLDAKGNTLAQGPIPVAIVETPPLLVRGRFGAPSFDLQALNRLLTDSGAVLDWQIQLGKAVTRSETARSAIGSPQAILVDAAYLERADAATRKAVLAQVGQGASLIVLAGNAADSGWWRRELDLPLRAVGQDEKRAWTLSGNRIALSAPNWQPDGGHWSVLATDEQRQPWLWRRDWRRGRIVWLGAADWHRYAITAPRALGLWWQQVFDLGGVSSAQTLAWRFPDPMPQPQRRSELCAQGVGADAPVQVEGESPMRWLARADHADAACVALWPRQAGWMRIDSAGQQGRMYVYDKADWPRWQQTLRHQAMALYAARQIDAAPAATSAALPRWPFALAFAACLLLLWWRERRHDPC